MPNPISNTDIACLFRQARNVASHRVWERVLTLGILKMNTQWILPCPSAR